MLKEPQNLIVVTTTYSRANRIAYMKRMVKMLSRVKSMKWLIIEDGDACDPEVEALLVTSGIDYLYLFYGPTRDYASSQRNFAFTYIRDHQWKGIVYSADDDNYYFPQLFEELRKTKRLAVFPVGHLGPNAIERPVLKNGRITGWDSGWKERKYPLDWAGISFNADILSEIPDPIMRGFNWFDEVKRGNVDPDLSGNEKLQWIREHKDGETEFLEKFVRSNEDFEILARNCSRCWAWHNQPLGEHPYKTYWERKREKEWPVFKAKVKQRLKKLFYNQAG